MRRVFGFLRTGVPPRQFAEVLARFAEFTPLTLGCRVVLAASSDDDAGTLAEYPALSTLDASIDNLSSQAAALFAYARGLDADLYLLSDSIWLAAGWSAPLAVVGTALLSPLTNLDVEGKSGHLPFGVGLDFRTLTAHRDDFDRAVEFNRKRDQGKGLRQILTPRGSVLKISRELLPELGCPEYPLTGATVLFTDLALRGAVRGFPLLQQQDSLVGVFGDDDLERRRHEIEGAWGREIAEIATGVRELRPEDRLLLKRGEFGRILVGNSGGRQLPVSPFKPTVGAVYCVYDDPRWLAASASSVYPHCDRLLFLVGSSPWNGEAVDNSATIAAIESIPDPDGKVRIVHGDWSTETDQRNAGLDLLAEDSIDFCLVVDADEVYREDELGRMIDFVAAHRAIEAWRVRWFTYWKSPRYRIEPMEAFAPVVLVRSGTLRFAEFRELRAGRIELVPPEITVCHHLSYARSDDEIRRKISTFSHAAQVRPDWFESVWKKWDANRTLQNLNPCWPESYRRAVQQPRELLPRVLHDHYDRERMD